LIQVNISGESTKYGLNREATVTAIKEMATLKNLNIRGLMTIAPIVDDPEKARPCFSGLRALRDRMAVENIPNVLLQELSMGMTDDFEVAVEEGATIVRIGRAIFGERK